MNENGKEKAGSLFYRRVESSPCLQQAFKYGIMSGFGGGLLGFLFTSSPLKASFWAFGTYAVSQYLIWFNCTRQQAKLQEENDRFRKALHYKLIYEGTDVEKEIDKMLIEKQKGSNIYISKASKEDHSKDGS